MRQMFYTCVVEPVFFALPIDNSARDAKSHVTVENNAHTYARTAVRIITHFGRFKVVMYTAEPLCCILSNATKEFS